MAAANAPYRMPPVCLGQVLIWAIDRGLERERTPGVVTCVGKGTIDLTLFPKGSRTGICKSGVRYVEDPELAKFVHNEMGCWDYTAFDKKMISVLE